MENPTRSQEPTPLVLNRSEPPPSPGGAAGWFVAPLLLSASLAGILLVMRGPDQLFLWAVGIAVLVAIAWMLVSVFFPASADRTCPSCRERTLERLDPGTTRGLTCEACGYRDETASSFLLAEEEGPLEDAVLNERDRSPVRPRHSATQLPAATPAPVAQGARR